MGRRTEELRVTARLSAHNDEQDDTDAALWDELRARVREVTEDPRYQDIAPALDL